MKDLPAVLGGEIFELWICLGDEGEFFGASPARDDFFSCDCGTNIGETFMEKEAVTLYLPANADLAPVLCSNKR